jgi:hypothetical protein
MSDDFLLKIPKNAVEWVIDHVIFPIQHPQCEDESIIQKEHALSQLVAAAAHKFCLSKHISNPQCEARWQALSRMLDVISHLHQTEILSVETIVSTVRTMRVGGTLPFHHLSFYN